VQVFQLQRTKKQRFFNDCIGILCTSWWLPRFLWGITGDMVVPIYFPNCVPSSMAAKTQQFHCMCNNEDGSFTELIWRNGVGEPWVCFGNLTVHVNVGWGGVVLRVTRFSGQASLSLPRTSKSPTQRIFREKRLEILLDFSCQTIQ
jgi:hypothetical protein